MEPTLHDLCVAYRAGHRWAHLDSGGRCWTSRTKREVCEYNPDPRAGEEVRELYREISFRVVGMDPFRLDAIIVPEDKFDTLTAEDWLTCAACIRKASSGKNRD